MSSGSSDNGNWGGENLDWLTSYGIYAEWREEDEADEGTYDVSEPSETESESGSGSGSGGDSEPEHESENGGEGEDEDEAATTPATNEEGEEAQSEEAPEAGRRG